ncbi:MAG: cellulase family glycosylhydrolase [Erythrobacter sp.]|nr:cellulase family glycosylhydrolase [Erythrobacter sp.]
MLHRALALVAAFIASTALAAPADQRISQHGRWFVAPDGRVVIIHGGNVMLPEFGAEAEPRWTDDTPAHMAEQGFNGVRLVVFLSGLMPSPGVIDAAYLERIATAVAAYKAAGIYTMIDFHQDEYGALVGTRGMPDWAVFSDGHQANPDLQFPMGYFNDPAVQVSFDNFWLNHPVPGTGRGVQDLYVDALEAVARRFADEPAVIGIDVMNEPATGSRCALPDPVAANCPELEQELLRPFYERASAAINGAAPEMIVFVEPFMLQGALGTPIATPFAARPGTRGFSFHNYGPQQEVRDRVNDGALSHAEREGAAIINTEWGFNNDPALVDGQADDFDARHISWLAWTRGAFEALVDPTLPDRGNGNRIGLLRAYARPYPEFTAGTPVETRFDNATGSLQYRYVTSMPAGSQAAGETVIRIPAVAYPNGYSAVVDGGTVISAPDADELRIRAERGAREVSLALQRRGDLPPLPATRGEPDRSEAALRNLPPIPEAALSRNSLIGHIVVTPGGQALLDSQVPGMLVGMSHVNGWERMTLAGIQQFASATLTDEKLDELDSQLARLPVTPGPVSPEPASAGRPDRLSIDSLTSDLLADPLARAILDREVPGLATSSRQGLFPQTRLRALQPALPELLTDAALERIERALAELPQPD